MAESNPIPMSMAQLIQEVSSRLSERPKLGVMFQSCFANTLKTTIQRRPDGSTFIITGDIPAMWLRG